MKDSTKSILEELTKRYPKLIEQKENIEKGFEMIANAYRSGNKLLVCGNGGSASDSEHIVGELMKQFRKKREIPKDVKEKLERFGENGKVLTERLEGSLPAVALTSHLALSTAFANDKEPTLTFAQQLLGLGKEGDVLLSISTSGNSKNCVYATTLAHAIGVKSISLTGQKESDLKKLSDLCICVPETETYKVQELHLPVYHCICAMLEEELF